MREARVTGAGKGAGRRRGWTRGTGTGGAALALLVLTLLRPPSLDARQAAWPPPVPPGPSLLPGSAGRLGGAPLDPGAAGPARERPVATATRAVRGATWGAAVGGVLGGLGVGVLASGLCDTGDCDGSFGQGFVVGMLAGGITGGLAGLVVGSAFPEGGRALGGWSWTVRGGARRAGARDVDGMGLSVGLRALRPTTEATWVGVAAEYLGDADHRATFRFGTRDGEAGEGRTLREWRIASVRMVAARWLGAHPGAGGHLLAGVGLYPTWEKFTWTRSLPSGPPQESREHSFVAAPGLGVGAGWVLPMGGRWGVELGARADLLAGVGSDGWLPLAQATVGLRRGRRGG